MSKLYGITSRTRERIRQLLDDGGKVGGRSTTGATARGVTWVKVTGAAVGDWYPAVVSLDTEGEWEDLTAGVHVASDSAALATGERYLCTRTGDADDGTAQFRSITSAASSGFFARLTTASSGKWKYVALTLDSGGAYVNDGSESAGYTATPLTIDGSLLCNPATGLRVWMLPSKQAGKQEFLPIGYASRTSPGLVSIAPQDFLGAKRIVGSSSGSTGFINLDPAYHGTQLTISDDDTYTGGEPIQLKSINGLPTLAFVDQSGASLGSWTVKPASYSYPADLSGPWNYASTPNPPVPTTVSQTVLKVDDTHVYAGFKVGNLFGQVLHASSFYLSPTGLVGSGAGVGIVNMAGIWVDGGIVVRVDPWVGIGPAVSAPTGTQMGIYWDTTLHGAPADSLYFRNSAGTKYDLLSPTIGSINGGGP